MKRAAAIAVLLSCAPSAQQIRLDQVEAEVRCSGKVMHASTQALLAKLDRTAAALDASERLRAAARELARAEDAVAAARTSAERRAAWRAWQDARAELRTAAR